jgi:hypothetical protein
VVVVTTPSVAERIVVHCVAAGVDRVWLHRGLGPGSSSDAAVGYCREHRIRVIPGGCPNMFGATSDPGHRCILAMLRLTGKLPRTGSGRERAAGGSIVTAVAKLALAATVTALYARVVRPRLLHSGATEEEVARDYSGAELVPGGTRGATMAATIEVPPSQVWPWLIQMGCDRAGWYSWDRLDNAGVSSADLIHPEWQQIAVGDHLLSRPGRQHVVP